MNVGSEYVKWDKMCTNCDVNVSFTSISQVKNEVDCLTWCYQKGVEFCRFSKLNGISVQCDALSGSFDVLAARNAVKTGLIGTSSGVSKNLYRL